MMTAPTPEFSAGETPDYAANISASTANPADFGPDPAGGKESPFENLKPTRRGRPPRNGHTPKTAADAFKGLGANKKTRSPVRKLTSDDRDKITSLYTFGSMGLMPFRPEAAEVMANSAEACADAWMELADQNDNVRRALLALLEGGVWGKLFAAHLPILVALVPQNALPPFFRSVGSMSVPDYPPAETGE